MNDQAPTHANNTQHANQLSIHQAVPSTEQPRDLTFTSDSPFLNSYINTELTDDEILTGDPKLITQERILQVSATHTAEEIANKVNTGQIPHALTPKLVYHRIHTACHSVATRNNTSFDMVKTALNNARVQSGAKDRTNKSLGRAVSAQASPISIASPKAAIPGYKSDAKGSDTSLTDLDDSPPNYLGNFFSSESTMKAANPLFKRIAKGGSKLPDNEDLMRLAAKYTVGEIVTMVQEADPVSSITSSRISARIMDAVTMLSRARKLPRDIVKKEFESAKQANGVVARHYGRISTKRKATTIARKTAVRVDSVMVVSPKSEGRKKRVPSKRSESVESNIEEPPDMEMEWNQEPITPPSEVRSEDTSMSDSDDETVAWLDSPTYAKYKPGYATPRSDLCPEDVEMSDNIKPCLSNEEAAKILLEMRWLGEPNLNDEGAALVLLKLRAEAQDVMMDMPSDLNN